MFFEHIALSQLRFCSIPNAQNRKKLAHRALLRAAASKLNLALDNFAGQHSLSSLKSQARATVHSRFTVAGERFITSAVSSMVSPPKYLSSTRRAWRGAAAARVLRALSRARKSIPSDGAATSPASLSES